MPNAIEALSVYDSNTVISDNGTLELSNTGYTNGLTIGGYYHDYWWPYCYHTTIQKSTIEQAFKIVNVLFKKKLIKVNTVKSFVDLVDEIAKVL